MAILEELGVCRMSGCEAIAIDCDGSYLLLGRPALFAGVYLGNYQVPEQPLRNLLERFVSAADLCYLQYLAGVLDGRLNQSLSKEALIEFFVSRLDRSIVAFELPKMSTGESDYPRATREPTAVEPLLIHRMLWVLNRATNHYLGPELQQQIRDLVSPANILTTAATFVGIAVITASGVGTGVMTAVGFALKGFEIFEIIRQLLQFIDVFMLNNLEDAARILALALTALGMAVIGIFLRRVGARVRRPRVETRRPSPSDNADFSDVSRDLGLDPPRIASAGRTSHASRAQSAVSDAQAAGFVDQAGNTRSVDLAVQPHGRASDVRVATGQTGATRQSAHVGATSLLARLQPQRRSDRPDGPFVTPHVRHALAKLGENAAPTRYASHFRHTFRSAGRSAPCDSADYRNDPTPARFSGGAAGTRDCHTRPRAAAGNGCRGPATETLSRVMTHAK